MPYDGHLPRLEGLLSAKGYAGSAYDLVSPVYGLALEVLARTGIDPADIEKPRKQ